MKVIENETQLPTDDYSKTLSSRLNHPTAITATATIDVVTQLGHSETWVVKTVRVEGIGDTLFLQVNNADGGDRFVLPASVANAIARQRETMLAVVRKRGANKAAATRKAKLKAVAG